MKCPNCLSVQIRKHGFYRGKQRYQCKVCKRQFIETYTNNVHPLPSTGVDEQIDGYIRSLSTPLSELSRELQQATAHYPLAPMQPTLAQVQLLAILLRTIAAQRVVEIGIFSSYATLEIALTLPTEGQLISCGVGGEHLELARSYWQRGGVAAKINFSTDSAIEVLERVSSLYGAGSCDAIIVSALKHQYLNYYQHAIELLRPNGLLIATDVLWQGRVLNSHVHNDNFTCGLDLFNHTLAKDDRLRVSLLPIGDGLSIAVKL